MAINYHLIHEDFVHDESLAENVELFTQQPPINDKRWMFVSKILAWVAPRQYYDEGGIFCECSISYGRYLGLFPTSVFSNMLAIGVFLMSSKPDFEKKCSVDEHAFVNQIHPKRPESQREPPEDNELDRNHECAAPPAGEEGRDEMRPDELGLVCSPERSALLDNLRAEKHEEDEYRVEKEQVNKDLEEGRDRAPEKRVVTGGEERLESLVAEVIDRRRQENVVGDVGEPPPTVVDERGGSAAPGCTDAWSVLVVVMSPFPFERELVPLGHEVTKHAYRGRCHCLGRKGRSIEAVRVPLQQEVHPASEMRMCLWKWIMMG
ncbi:hypothetical protein THAOC_21247 [Thalassiosira oceanica]|uniref:Uncharacterized protein n=1 Tax=Thalassiosira oceanica TaxID=159749 RepID=K0S1G9_THAOC|nr:hypothetical protein THAOC_21247 [Thalassiosira oceanica]|eukprot:EJK58614.1 hypothetical protein THAOC_21247 [Thalassiosira oceanica]